MQIRSLYHHQVSGKWLKKRRRTVLSWSMMQLQTPSMPKMNLSTNSQQGTWKSDVQNGLGNSIIAMTDLSLWNLR